MKFDHVLVKKTRSSRQSYLIVSDAYQKKKKIKIYEIWYITNLEGQKQVYKYISIGATSIWYLNKYC